MMRALLLLLLLLASGPVLALERPQFDPVPGTKLDLSAQFTDSDGAPHRLGDLLDGKPGLVLFGYHLCPNQCGVAQQVIATALEKSGLADEVTPLFISLVPSETADDAAAAQRKLREAIGGPADRWRFLSGPAGVALARQFGVGALERERILELVHPIAAFTVTPDGRLSHALPGLGITSDQMRLAVVDAAEGTVGSLIDHIVLWCAGYDDSRGAYTPWIIGALRAGAIATLAFGLVGIGALELGRRRWKR